MPKQYPIRYGRNYKIVLALILPGLITPLFILAVQYLPELEEWMEWLIIFIFLGALILLTLWLVFRVYPKAVLTIKGDEVSLSFNRAHIFRPRDFSFNVSDITSMSNYEIGGDTCFLIVTRQPYRKFQISPATRDIEEKIALDEAMEELGEAVG